MSDERATLYQLRAATSGQREQASGSLRAQTHSMCCGAVPRTLVLCSQPTDTLSSQPPAGQTHASAAVYTRVMLTGDPLWPSAGRCSDTSHPHTTAVRALTPDNTLTPKVVHSVDAANDGHLEAVGALHLGKAPPVCT